MPFTFKPLSLTPFTRGQKKRLISAADDPSKIYVFPFNLSGRPPAKWGQMFQVVWFEHYGGSAIPSLDGDTILIRSSPSDLQVILSSLKLIVASTNERYVKVEGGRVESEDARKRTQEESKRAAERFMSDALDGLKF